MALSSGRPRRRSREWLWPLLPSSWASVHSRLSSATVQILRLTVASVVAYVVADAVYPGILDLTAPLTALLVVQASTVGTLQMGLVRVGAVLTGVLVAVGLTSFIQLSWWSLATAIATSLVLARVFRLGEQSLEAPISAMLILAVSSPDVAAQVRVANTLIGTAVGIAFSLLVPVSIPNAGASEAVRRVARSQAALLDEVALTLGEGPPDPQEVAAWSAWADHISSEIADAALAVRTVQERRRLNPRALTAAKVHPALQSALARLDRCLAAERVVLSVLADEKPGAAETDEASSTADLRRTFAVVLDDVATGLRAFGDVIGAEYGADGSFRADEALEQLVQVLGDVRAMLAELMNLEITPGGPADQWILQGSVLTAIEQVLRQLDLEGPVGVDEQ